jgi:hypothetical protein
MIKLSPAEFYEAAPEVAKFPDSARPGAVVSSIDNRLDAGLAPA